MSIEKLHDQLLHGLAHDLMFAKRYFYLFKEIEAHWDKINLLNELNRSWILLLKDSAVQQTVIYLSKIYDSSGVRKSKDTRCLRDLLKQLDNKLIDEAKKVITLTPKLWQQFYEKHRFSMQSLGDTNATNFIERAQFYLDSEFSKDESIKNKTLTNLKTFRNKKVAHNESYDQEDEEVLSINHAEQIIIVADAILDYLNTFMSIGIIGLYSNQEYMIREQVANIFKNINDVSKL